MHGANHCPHGGGRDEGRGRLPGCLPRDRRQDALSRLAGTKALR